MPEPLTLVRLGTLGYLDAWDLQRRLHTARLNDEIGDHLLLLDHTHVLTVGSRGGKPDLWENLRADRGGLEARGVHFVESDRGGDVTWHGPGQLVVYPIVKLDSYGRDVGRYVWMLEEIVLHTLGALGILAARSQGYPGVWIGGEKIAAIGARIKRWVTMHGTALNVRGPLEGFDWIVPCGLQGKGVTSVERQLPTAPPDDEAVLQLVADAASAVLDRQIVEGDPSELKLAH